MIASTARPAGAPAMSATLHGAGDGARGCRGLAFRARVFAAVLLLSAAMPAFAHFHVYSIVLDGSSVAPPNNSQASGTATITFDLDLITMRVQVDFSGLSGTATGAHIHCCTAQPGPSTSGTAGPATPAPAFIAFPLGVTNGAYDRTFDLSDANSYDPAFIAASGGTIGDALNALTLGAEDGKAYLDIETSAFPGGEVRGFLVAVPGQILDVDANETFDALTDGVLVLRYMFGLSGSALTSNATADTATRTDPAAVKDYLDGIRSSLDIDGNGSVDALTDGVLILRFMFGLRGSALTNGAVDPSGTRTASAAIEDYLITLLR